ncbi:MULTISPECIES: translocation/assembly module TamB domain-containing protein [unclassified Rubrivivax]|uniref:translocation/assembly module TamB domain-containing protein n=1 Tax=unclassified Rubrivivax TaxID=2649762 RepID=UPI001E64BDF3|nr:MULTISPECIES: translocation/assembly module TamB domain-containing protein [unclassified Rubrivivax]MCC9597276.1 translocation/assembly module TamB domain-containing protein [Rubrivivax sp. JA1055]MCC9646466.1 translocation/assembly module TamB domain-containing protein [Rubrivivax sp. JA1029]
MTGPASSTTNAANGAPPRRRLAAWLAAAAALTVAAGAGAAWVWNTEAGWRWLLARVPGLEVDTMQGRPVAGGFAVRELRWQDADGARLRVENLAWRDLSWRWRPHAGAWAGIVLDTPSASRVEWTAGTAAPEPAPARRRAPEDLRLPLALEIRSLAVGALEIGGAPPLSDLRADLALGAEGGTLHRLGRLELAWPGGRARASASVGTDGERRVQARVDAAAAPGAALPWTAALDASGSIARLQLAATLAGDGGARLDAKAAVAPFAPWPLESLQASTRALDLAQLAPALPSTRLEGRIIVDSQGRDVPVNADLELRNSRPGAWDAGQLPLASLVARIAGRLDGPRRIELQAFDARLAGERPAGRLQGRGHWEGDTLDLALALEALRPGELDRRLPAMTLGGPLTLRLSGLPGAATPPAALDAVAKAELSGRLDTPRGRPVTLALDASWRQPQDGTLQAGLQRLLVAAGDARLEASASVARDAAAVWRLRSRGELSRLDPSAWWRGADGSPWRRGPHALNGRWNADLGLPQSALAQPLPTLLAALAGEARAELRDSVLAGVALQAGATLKGDGRAAQADAELNAAGNRATLALRSGARDAARLVVEAGSPQALAPLAGLVPGAAAWWPSAGTLALDARADGRWPALRTQGTLAAAGLRSPAYTLQQADARWNGSTGSRDAPLELALQARGLARGEQRLERLDASVAGTLGSHRIVLEARTPLRPPAWTDVAPAPAGGPTTLRLQAGGAWVPERAGGGRWRATIAELSAGAEGATPWVLARDLDFGADFAPDGAPRAARLAPGRLALLGAALRWREAGWQAPPRDGAPSRLQLAAELEPLALAPWLQRAQPDAGWSGDLKIAGRVDIRRAERFDADIVLERHEGDLSVVRGNLPIAFGFTGLRFALAAHDGRWETTQAVVGTQIGVIAGSQTVRANPALAWPEPQAPVDGVVEMRIPDLDVWSAWLPAGWRLGGTLFTTAQVGGTAAAPQFGGRVEGSRLEVGNLLQGVDLDDGSLLLTLRGEALRLEQLRLRGGDGTLAIDGSARLGAAPSAELSVVAERFEALSRVDRRIAVSGRATLGLRPDALVLHGRFGVDRGRIDISRSEAPSLDADVVVENRPPRPGQRPAPPAPGTREPSALMKNSRVALELALGEDLRLTGRGVDTGLTGTLRVSTPQGRLAINGLVRTVGGRYAAYGQNLAIERGLIRFAGEVAAPRLDILAVRPDLDVRVGVTIQGSASDPRVRLYSEPEMSELDKLSWLVTGRASEGLGRADTAILQQAALALLAGENGGPSTGLLQRLGLDELSVSQSGDGDTRDTVVTIGKQLSDRLYVGYERGVNATAGSWQLIYRVARRFTVRAQTGDESAVDVIWAWRWN